jgi:hypothetical protein
VPFQTFVGSLTAPAASATGNQSVTAVGFRPKALIFFGDDHTATGENVHAVMGFGMATSASNECAFGYFSLDAAATSGTERSFSNALSWVIENTAGTQLNAFELVSMDADGFTVNWTVNDAAQDIVNFMALGGSTLTDVALVEFQSAASTNSSVTGVGFKPQCVIFATAASGTQAGNTADAVLTIGAASSATERYTIGIHADDTAGSGDDNYCQVTDRVIRTMNIAGAAELDADIVSFDDDGFTLDWNTAVAGRYCYALCLRGGSYKVAQVTQAVDTGTEAYTSIGFRPTGLFLTSANAAANTTSATTVSFSLGAVASTTSRANIWVGGVDGADPTQEDRYMSQSTVIAMRTPGADATTVAECDLTSFDNNGFTLNWSTADATARLINVLAFGGSAGGGGGGGQGGGGGGNSGGGGGGNPGGGPPGQGGGGPPGQGGGKGDRFFMSNLRRRRKQFVGF